MGDTDRSDIRMRTRTDMEWSMGVCQDQFRRMAPSRCPQMDVARLPPLPGSDILEPTGYAWGDTRSSGSLFIHSHIIKRTYLSNSVGIATVPAVLILSYHHLFLVTYHNLRTMYPEPSRFVFTSVHFLRLHVSSTPFTSSFVFVSRYLSWTVKSACIIHLGEHPLLVVNA